MFICEIYKSIQGEGLLTGTESIFLRTSGCNLRCGFCDSPWSSWKPEGEQKTVKELLDACRSLDCRHVVLTGGEPMLQKEVVELTQCLADNDFHITIETAGTLDNPVACDLMSISPKLSNSSPGQRAGEGWMQRHEQERFQPQVIRALVQRYDYQLKFVIDQPSDLQESLEWIRQFPELRSDRIWMMPEGVEQHVVEPKEAWIEKFCEQHGFQLCRRMQIAWFGNRRGT